MTRTFYNETDELLPLIKDSLTKMSDEERLEFFDLVEDGYCRYCGSDDPKCQCWNDE